MNWHFYRSFYLIIGIVLITASVLSAQKDSIVTTNGQIIVGEIKHLKIGV